MQSPRPGERQGGVSLSLPEPLLLFIAAFCALYVFLNYGVSGTLFLFLVVETGIAIRVFTSTDLDRRKWTYIMLGLLALWIGANPIHGLLFR